MDAPWIRSLLRWLKRFFRARTVPSVQILERYHVDGIGVLRLADASIPGCVDLWRIDYGYNQRFRFFLCLISLAELRQSTARRNRGNALGLPRTGTVAVSLELQLKDQANVLATHYWIVGFNRPVFATDAKGRSYQAYRTSDVQLLACDLQGPSGSFVGNRHARRYARLVIRRLARGEFREYNQHQTWEDAVKSIDWHEWLQGLSRSVSDGISETHVLCPPRSKRLRY